MPRLEKGLMLDELKGFLSVNDTVFMAECSGVGVNQMNAFRKNLKKEGASCKVFKNTLLCSAFAQAPWKDVLPAVSGPTLLVSAGDNPVAVARVVSGFADAHKGVQLKAGLVDRSFVTGEEIIQIAKLPVREVLIAKLLGGLKSPISRFVSVVNAPVGAFISVLNIISKQTGGDSDGRE